ncbi:MAG: PDZ domain-containing protein [Terriglobia bacterium]
MKTLRRLISISILSFTCAAIAQQMPEGRLMRFPDISKDQIAFSYAGDLWLVSREGGVARRLTTHPGLELFPKFSPDGRSIAFTGQYDGNFNVYVMPAEGGDPKQLTFHPGGGPLNERMGIHNEVLTWFPDSKRIVYLSRRDTFNDWFGRPFVVSVDGGLSERLPIDKGGLMSFSPDGTRMAYNRIFRNFRTWKRYTGGMAQDIWIYNFKANTIEQMPHTEWTDTFPMWHEDTIYFDSDRGAEHRLNLYSYSLKSHEIRQLTHFKDFDVEWPSLGSDAIVFENGGYLYVFDLQTEKAKKLTIYLPGDRELARKHWDNVSKLVTTAFDISPDGKRALLSARGDVFTVPAKEGSIRNLTRTPGIRERDAAWSPDGRWVAYVSDRTGEDELYVVPQDGMGPETRITSDGAMYRLAPAWSPDSKKLLYANKDCRLYYVDVKEKKPVLIDQNRYFDLNEYVWSPDSHWVAYGKNAPNHNEVLYFYSLDDSKITPVTTDFYSSHGPAFDPDGHYFYFLSERDYNEVLGVFDSEFANPKATRVYATTLRADAPSPFAPQSDEVTVKPPETPTPVPGTPPGNPPATPAATPAKPAAEESKATKPEAATTEEKEKKKEPFRIDLAGVGNRIVALPIPYGNYGSVLAASDRVFYVSAPVSGLSGPLPGESPAIHVFDLKERKDHVLVDGANSYALSFDGNKLLYSAPAGPPGSGPGGGGNTYGIVDAKVPEGTAPPHKVGDDALNLARLEMEVDPPAEWKQIFNEVWRQERDYFFEPSMNGVDWPAQREKYAQLLPHVADRYDLTYVLGEMIGELSNSHTYVGGGDSPDLHPVNIGLLGADFEADTEHGLYRFKKIYPGENWNPGLRSPLTEPGVDVKQGDYLLAVDGRPLRAPQSPDEIFLNTANENVTLTVNSKPTEDGARHVVVKPLSDDFGLHELDMIETNRRKVDEATGGRVGYVYLPDMDAAGLNEFVKQFFPQIRKEGLIIDVRYNGGGFVDQIIFERLRRVLAGMEGARNFESDTDPSPVFHGYMACITNHYAASDGDYFSYFFKQYKLGPLIGERTWGGVRGIRGYIPLMDGGYVTRPEFSLYGLDSRWLIENRGVAPDIEVDNRPDLVMAGHDPQLEKAIEVVMQEIREHPKKLPPRPADLPTYPPGPGL